MKKHYSGLSFLVACLIMSTFAQTVSAETERKVDPWYQDGLFIYDMTSNSINPANISNLPYSGLNDISVSYSADKGRYRAFDGSVKSRLFDANIFGIRKFDDLSFKGGINYSNNYNEDMRWNATALTSERNPFLLADTLRYDSLTNDSRTESFRIDGTVSYQFSDMITAGLTSVYTVAQKTDQSDPRMKAIGARTRIIPGINFTFGKFTLGLAGMYEIYHEDDKSSVEDNMISEHNNVYIFKGLGGYEGKDGLGYNRRYDGHKFGGSLNFHTSGTFRNFTELSFISNSEDAIDGDTSYSYRGGDFSQTTMALYSRFSYNANNRIQHDLIITASMDNNKGKWYNQKQKKDSWNMIYYEVTSTEIIHKESDMAASLTYCINFIKSDVPHMTASVTAGYNKADIKQFPDENYAKYAKVNAGLSLSKKWIAGKMRYLTDITASMNHAVSPLDISVITDTPALRRFYNGYYLPKFTYLSADDYCVSLALGASYPLSLFSKDGWLNLTVNASMKKYSGDSPLFKDTDKNALGIKLNYTF